MRQYAGTLNRSWLALLGALALLGGLYVIVASAGALPGPENGSKVDAKQFSSVLDRTEVLVGVAVVGAILGVLAFAWLIAQFPRTNKARPIRFHDDATRGLTLCDPGVVTAAVETDLRSLASVTSADAVLRGTAAAPELTMRVGFDDRADLQTLMRDLRTEVIANFATAMGTPPSRLGVLLDVERGKRTTDSVTIGPAGPQVTAEMSK